MAFYIKKKVNGVEQEPKRVGVIPNGYPARKIGHSSGGNLEEMLNYSTDEHIVGKWIDGSPLYEKTVSFGALPNATSKTVAHGITFARVVEYKGYASNSEHSINIALPFSDTTASGSVNVVVTTDVISITTGINRETFTESYVTIRYTKA